MENYHIVLKVKLKKSKHLSETSTTSLTVKFLVRKCSMVVAFCQQEMRDRFVWQQQLKNSYPKFILSVTSRSAQPTHPCHVLMGPTNPPSSVMYLCNGPLCTNMPT